MIPYHYLLIKKIIQHFIYNLNVRTTYKNFLERYISSYYSFDFIFGILQTNIPFKAFMFFPPLFNDFLYISCWYLLHCTFSNKKSKIAIYFPTYTSFHYNYILKYMYTILIINIF